MADPRSTRGTALAGEISASLGGLWKLYTGTRPANIDTAIEGTRIACVLEDAVVSFDDGIAAAEAADLAPGERRLTQQTFRQDAITAVAKSTHRRVVAFVSKHDSDTDTATEVFILDNPLAERPSLVLDRNRMPHQPRLRG
jgi:uncharacterized protein YbcI